MKYLCYQLTPLGSAKRDRPSGKDGNLPNSLASDKILTRIGKWLSRLGRRLRGLVVGGYVDLNYANDSEQTNELLKRVSDGQASALDDLLQLHRPFLQRLVSLRMNPELSGRVDASDVVQETLIVISKRIDDFLDRRPTTFRMWIRRKAMERLIDQRRIHIGAAKRSVRSEKHFADSSLAIARTLLTDTPSKIFRLNELYEQVRELIDGLGDKDREILTLRHAEGLSTAEVADLLKTTPNNARQRYGRALRRLHEQLAAHGISLAGQLE